MKPTKDEIVKNLHELKPLLEGMGIEHIALFGSVIKDCTHTYSDIDIAFKKSKEIFVGSDVYNYFKNLKKTKSILENRFKKRVDLFDLDSASSLKKIIQKELVYVW